MNIDIITEFIALARESNVTATARQLHISKSALSKHISQLEEELGVKLFERDRTGMRMTQAGIELFPILFEAGSAWEEAGARAREISSQTSRRLVVSGMTDDREVINILAQIYATMGKEDEHFTLDFASSRWASHADALRKADLVFDFEWDAEFMEATGAQAIRLANVPFVAIVRNGHHLAERPFITVDDLKGETLMRMKGVERDWAWVYVESNCLRHGFKPEFRSNFGTQTVDLLATSSQLQNEVLVIAKSYAERSGLDHSPLVTAIPIEDEDVYMPLSVMYDPSNANPALGPIIEMLERHQAQL